MKAFRGIMACLLVVLSVISYGKNTDAETIKELTVKVEKITHTAATLEVKTISNSMSGKTITVCALYNGENIGTSQITMSSASMKAEISFNRIIMVNDSVSFYAMTPEGNESEKITEKIPECGRDNRTVSVGTKGIMGHNPNIHGGKFSVEIGGDYYTGDIDNDGYYYGKFENEYLEGLPVSITESCNGGCVFKKNVSVVSSEESINFDSMDVYPDKAIYGFEGMLSINCLKKYERLCLTIEGDTYYSEINYADKIKKVTIMFDKKYDIGTTVSSIWIENVLTGIKKIPYEDYYDLSDDELTVKSEDDETDGGLTVKSDDVENNDDNFINNSYPLKRIGEKNRKVSWSPFEKKDYYYAKTITIRHYGVAEDIVSSNNKVAKLLEYEKGEKESSICLDIMGYGTTVITATKGNEKIEWKLIVEHGASFSVNKGRSVSIKELTKLIPGKKNGKWKSSNSSVASVKGTMVKAKKRGATTLSIKANKIKYKFKVKVYDKSFYESWARVRLENAGFQQIKIKKTLFYNTKIKTKKSGWDGAAAALLYGTGVNVYGAKRKFSIYITKDGNDYSLDC